MKTRSNRGQRPGWGLRWLDHAARRVRERWASGRRPGPGTYEVTARLPEAEWTQTVHLGDETHLVASASYPETRCKTVEEEW